MKDTLIETATIDIEETEMSEDHAIGIMEHLIKHNYAVTQFTHDAMSYWTIRAKRPYVVYPESPRVKMDDLIKLFDKAITTFRETGKVNIEIDQGLGALDISVRSMQPIDKTCQTNLTKKQKE